MIADKKNRSLVKNFDRYLTEMKLRHTPERYRIIKEIKKINNHFEADDLVFQIRKKKIPVSRATVYRTLALLEESGFLRKFRFDEKHCHYELKTENPHHAHLVCTECGKIAEFDDDELDKIQTEVCGEYNYQPVRRSVEIYGVCPKCRQKTV